LSMLTKKSSQGRCDATHGAASKKTRKRRTNYTCWH